jgi:hypothetical protein
VSVIRRRVLRLGRGVTVAFAVGAFVEARQGASTVEAGRAASGPVVQEQHGPNVPPIPRGTGVIRGRVIDGTRGTPIARATVTAMVSVVPPGATGEPGAASHMFGRSQSVRTDAAGSFAFTGLPPSRVALSAHREGFHPAAPAPRGRDATPSGQPVVTLGAGATVDAPDLLLVRGGALTGRVVDALGDPVIGAQVLPLGRVGDPGQPWRMAASPAQTDDRGTYRVYGLRAGRYTVQVVPRALRRGQSLGVIQGDTREPLRAFAPGVTDVGAAEFVEITHGIDMTLDVRLPIGRTAMVAGQVVPDDATPLAEVQVSLRSADARVELHFGGARVDGTGRFAMPDIPPGRYQLVAEEALPTRAAVGPMRPGRSGKIDVVVEGVDITEIAVPIGPGATITGRVEIDGGSANALEGRPLHLNVRRHPSEVLPGRFIDVEAAPDLTFTMSGVHGRHTFHADRLPEGWWLKSITIGGRDALTGFDAPRRGTVEDVIVLISARPTGVSGRVEHGAPVPAGAFVIAIGVGIDDLPEDMTFRTQGQPIQADGTFALRGLRPGRYVLAALTQDAMLGRADGSLEQQFELMRTVGTTVDVTEGRVETATLRLVDEPVP